MTRGSSDRPRVLVLANRLPFPVDDGWKTRTFHILRGLAERAAVTLLTFHDGPAEDVTALRAAVPAGLDVVTVPAPRIHSPGRLVLGLVTPTPVYIWNTRSGAFRRELDRLVAGTRPAAVVSVLTYMYPYLYDLPAGVRRIVDTHNIDSVVLRRYAASMTSPLRRYYAARTAPKLRRHEARVFGDADQVWVCSDKEARLAREMAPGADVRVVPNGVDTDALAPLPDVAPVPHRLLFFGRMDYEPNRDAIHHLVRDILPELRRRRGNIEIQVVGGGIGPDLEALAREAPELRLTGRVDDLRPVIAEAAVVIVPLRMGGGTRLKILEALSLGRPVVSTAIGAEGLGLVPGSDLLLADSAADFAAAITALLEDPAMGARLGSTGRATAIRRYDWRRIQELTAPAIA